MSEVKTRFKALPATGFTLDDAGFSYRVLAAQPHTNRDGTPSQVITWEGQCAECGSMFSFKTGASIRSLPRRCPPHAKGKTWARVKPYGSTAKAEAEPSGWTPAPAKGGWTPELESEVERFLRHWRLVYSHMQMECGLEEDFLLADAIQEMIDAWVDKHTGLDLSDAVLEQIAAEAARDFYGEDVPEGAIDPFS